jgi:hypothetical protein
MEQRVLILTNPHDLHALAVGEVLSRRGIETHFWHPSDFPILQTGSLSISENEEAWELESAGQKLGSIAPTTVWARHPRPPVLPASLQDSDRVFAARECTMFLRAAQQWVGRGAFWVNPLLSQWRAGMKPEQLHFALQAGFRIPKTLYSNSPGRIREFLRQTPGRVVYKPFFPVAWRSQEKLAVTFTSLITEEDLPEDEILQATPGIFQEYVDKAYELRVTAVGNRLFTAKFRSQEVLAGSIDWRSAPYQIPIESYDLPAAVEAACLRLMEDLGLVFGCFDLIVTPQREYVFLEVNEMGAFLWIEQRLPELELLDAFCELLIQGRRDFHWRKSGKVGRWTEVVEEVLRREEAASAAGHSATTSGTTFDEGTEA